MSGTVRVPMVDLAARHRRLAGPTEAAVLEVLRSGRWVGGPRLAEAEARLAALFGRAHGVGVNSGTDALSLALQALGVGPGHEVLVPALSFFATAGAVARIGARPVVVDVLPDLPLMCPEAARAALTARTRAAVPVHLFGMTCPDPGLPVPLVEDSAQAVGQAPPARLGVLTAASFYPTKTLGAAGDAGLVATDDPALAAAVRRLGGHGAVAGEAHLHALVAGQVGGNSRLDPLQAAILLAQLDDLPRRVARRRAIAARYDAALPAGFAAPTRAAADPVHHYLLRGAGRDALARWLAARGVESAIYYPRPLSAQPALQPQAPCPVAEAWSRTCLSLPCHEELTAAQVALVVASLEEFAP
ncbi:MAG: DegT/DnrJ/EryC1/StrS family aminotransferase [Pseudomonadota bacterium]